MREKVKECAFNMSSTCFNVTNLSSWEPDFTHVSRLNRSQLVQVNTSQKCEWNDDVTQWKSRRSLCHTSLCRVNYPGNTFFDLWEYYFRRWDHRLTSDWLSDRDSVLSNSRKQWITNTILRAAQPRTSSRYCYKNNTFLEITLNSSVVSHQFHPSPPQHWKPLLITEKC